MIPDRLLAARVLGGIPGSTLDRLAGLAEGHVRLIETGRRPNPEAATLEPLACVLGVSLDWLIAGKGVPPSEEQVKAAVAAARQRQGARS